MDFVVAVTIIIYSLKDHTLLRRRVVVVKFLIA